MISLSGPASTLHPYHTHSKNCYDLSVWSFLSSVFGAVLYCSVLYCAVLYLHFFFFLGSIPLIPGFYASGYGTFTCLISNTLYFVVRTTTRGRVCLGLCCTLRADGVRPGPPGGGPTGGGFLAKCSCTSADGVLTNSPSVMRIFRFPNLIFRWFKGGKTGCGRDGYVSATTGYVAP